MALFGRQAQQRANSRYLVEFKAGKMVMDGEGLVKPDTRKGLIYISKNEDDLLHFCWKERSATNPEDDLIIFPNEVEFKRVPQCTTGRVFVLKFSGSARRLFYWMQESDSSKDEDTFKKISDYLAGKTPPRTAAASEGGASGGIPAELQALGLDDSTLQEMLGGIDRSQLMQMLGMGGSSGGSGSSSARSQARSQESSGAAATATATATATPISASTGSRQPGGAPSKPTARPAAPKAAAPKIQLSDLRSILGNVQATPGSTSEGEQQASATPDWNPALSQTVLLPILSNPTFVERLLPYLPQEPNIPHTAQEVMSTIQSPQFQQAIQGFTSAFESRQLGPLIQEFNLGAEAVQAARSGDFRAFVKALEKNKPPASAQSGKEPAKQMDDEMNVD